MAGRKWSKYEDEYVKRNYGAMTCNEISKHINRTKMAVRKRLEVLGLTKPAKKYTFNESYFEKIDREDKAYWLGFIAADGAVVDDKETKRVKIALRFSDVGHLIKFRAAIHGNMPIKKKRSVNKKWNIYTDECLITVHSKKMVKDLENLGLYPRKTYALPFPSEEQVPLKYMKDYLRGFIDADGSFTLRQRKGHKLPSTEFSIVGATKQFLEDCASFLSETLNIRAKVYDKRKGNWRVIVSSCSDVLTILNYIYDDIESPYFTFLTRKIKKHLSIQQICAVSIRNNGYNQPGKNWKPKLNISMVIRAEGNMPRAEHSR